jgi:hypothetical protein
MVEQVDRGAYVEGSCGGEQWQEREKQREGALEVGMT